MATRPPFFQLLAASIATLACGAVLVIAVATAFGSAPDKRFGDAHLGRDAVPAQVHPLHPAPVMGVVADAVGPSIITTLPR